MNLAVWEGEGQVRLYSYKYKDTVKERVSRFVHFGLTRLWDAQQLLDLDVMVGGQLFRCHRVIMGSVSGYFLDELTSERFRSQRQPDKADTLVLDDSFVTPDVFQKLLDMFYEGKDILQDDDVLDIMKAATYLRIRSLELRCLDILVKQLGESSCLKIWDWAEASNLASLASKAKGVALSNFQVLRHTEDFLRVPPERLTIMLGHELLNYQFEDDILQAILDWVDYDRPDRRQHLKELLPYVCFPYLSTRYLNELRKHELIGVRSEFGSYVDEALTYHLAALQKGGKKIQMEVLKRQAQSLKRLMPGMRRVVVLIGGAVVQEEPLTNVVALYMDMAHPQSRYGEVLQFSIASLPQPLGLRFASTVWKHEIFVSGGSRSPDALLVYKPSQNTWVKLKGLPEGREDHAMVAADGKIYILGGRGASKAGIKVISDVSLYDIEADLWKPAGQLPIAVEAAPAVLLADKIYVFGGRTSSGESVAVVQQLDLVTGQSRLVGELPEEVDGAKALVLGKDIVLVCPGGAIYTIRESSRVRTLTDDHEPVEDFLSSLDPVPLTAAEQKEAKQEEEKEEKDGPAQQSAKGKGVKGGKVDWSMLDVEGKERVPNLKRMTEDSFVQKKDTDAEPAKATTSADEEEPKKPHAAADAEESGDDDEDQINRKESDEKEAGTIPTTKDSTAADAAHKSEDEEEEKAVEKDADHSEKTGDDADDNTMESLEETRPEDAEREDGSEEEEDDDDRGPHQAEAVREATLAEEETCDIIITKVATMEKRRDFGIFIRKADVMVVGGQSENGFFLDDILKIHIPTGQVCKTDGKLLIPISGMQVESSAIHQSFLVQFFDATCCFFGE